MHCRIVGKDDFKGTGLHTLTLGSELLPAPAPALVVAWVTLTQSPLTVRIGGAAVLVLVPGRKGLGRSLVEWVSCCSNPRRNSHHQQSYGSNGSDGAYTDGSAGIC